MELMLERIEKQVGAQTHLYPLDLTLVPRAVTVLLGATQAGKTSLMRVMAGLDAPSQGRVLADGRDVTGQPVRDRNVSMVYQQFVNYPSMTVADNIASPLRLRGAGELLQYGPTAEVFHRPKSIRVARAFSDPPMNLVAGTAASLGVTLSAGLNLSVPLPAASTSSLMIGIRASALRVRERAGD